MNRNIFTHVNEYTPIRVQLTVDGNPIDLSAHWVEFATAKEVQLSSITTLSSANTSQISTVNANTATVEIKFTPVSNAYNTSDQYVYQVQIRNKTSNNATLMLEGSLYLTPSLFD